MTEKQIEASRRNGANSRGPKTPAGKARSSRNATRHGLLSKILVLDIESQEIFDGYFKSLIKRYQPTDEFELGIVEEMAAAVWRTRRSWAIEQSTLNTRTKTYNLESGTERLANAFAEVANKGNEFHALQRYEIRHSRAFWRAVRGLERLRTQKFPNEPET